MEKEGREESSKHKEYFINVDPKESPVSPTHDTSTLRYRRRHNPHPLQKHKEITKYKIETKNPLSETHSSDQK
jgi:hypothetical protein